MSYAASNPNRRCESRYRTLTGQQMSWINHFSVGAFRKGWLMDVSKSGLGIMVERERLPKLGESIDVRLKPASDPISYEVIRIQDGNSKIVVVGCERVDGRPAEIDLPEPAWAMPRAA